MSRCRAAAAVHSAARATLQLLAAACVLCLLAATGTAAARGVDEAAAARAHALKTCFNQRYNNTPSVFEDFLRGFNTRYLSLCPGLPSSACHSD
jgi:hypothetical protein